MSEELNQTQIVKEFLKEVKTRLPGWLKDDKKELKDVLSELEGHIWEKSEEIAAGEGVQLHHIQQAVHSMGNPRDIASEYKKRGTPKLWISKELFPSYIKVVGIVISVIIGLNMIAFIVDTVENGLRTDLLSYLDGIFSSSVGVFLIVTIIFVVLSVEGYLPENFKKSKIKTEIGSIPSEKPRMVLKQVKPPLKRGELLAGAMIQLLIGLAMFSEVWVYIPLVEDIGVELTLWIKIAGIYTIVGGVINLIQSMMDLTNYLAQRVLMTLFTIKDLAFIPFILQLSEAVLSVPAINYISITDPDLFSTIVLGFKVITGFVLFGTAVGFISNIYKIVTLRMKYEEYLRYQES